MPQITRYPENMTIAQVIDMIRDIRGQSIFTDEELIESFGLPSIQTKKMGTLSGGTRQKVGAALAFLFNPSILILDEPTAGLDPASSGYSFKRFASSARCDTLALSSRTRAVFSASTSGM